MGISAAIKVVKFIVGPVDLKKKTKAYFQKLGRYAETVLEPIRHKLDPPARPGQWNGVYMRQPRTTAPDLFAP